MTGTCNRTNSNDTSTTLIPTISCPKGTKTINGVVISNIPAGYDGEYQALPCPGQMVGMVGLTCQRGVWIVRSTCAFLKGKLSYKLEIYCQNKTLTFGSSDVKIPSGFVGLQFNTSCPDGYSGNITSECLYNNTVVAWTVNGTCTLQDGISFHLMFISLIAILLLI